MGIPTNKYTLLAPSSNDSEEPYAGGPKQSSRPSNQQKAGERLLGMSLSMQMPYRSVAWRISYERSVA